jgi:hypothetical protein
MDTHRTAKIGHKWKTTDTWTLLGGTSRHSFWKWRKDNVQDPVLENGVNKICSYHTVRNKKWVVILFSKQRDQCYKKGMIKSVQTTLCIACSGWLYRSQNNATTGVYRRHVCAFHAKRFESQFQQPTRLRFPSASGNIPLQWRTGFEQTEDNFTHRQ